MRIFLDANVLFSAAKSDGAIRELLRRLLEAGHACCVDDYVVTEARRNLATKGPDALTQLEALLGRLQVVSTLARTAVLPETAWLPEKDRPVLVAAMRLRCAVLVTGDRRHFGSGYGRTFGGGTVHSPRSLAEALSI